MGPACVQGCSSQAAGRPEEWRRGIDILSASWEESPSGYRESGQQEEGEEVGRLTGVSTAIVSGFLLGSPHRDIRKHGAEGLGAAGGRGAGEVRLCTNVGPPRGETHSPCKGSTSQGLETSQGGRMGYHCLYGSITGGQTPAGSAGTSKAGWDHWAGRECPGTRKKYPPDCRH